MGLLCMAYLLEHDKKDVSKYISRDHSCHFWIWNHIWTDWWRGRFHGRKATVAGNCGIVFGGGSRTGRSNGRGRNAKTPQEIAAIKTYVEAGVMIVFLAILLWGMYSGSKDGTDIFQMADVNLLFTAPMKPQSVLMFRLSFQMVATVFASIYLVFQIPNLVVNMGLGASAVVAIFAGWILLLVFQRLMIVLTYTVCTTHEKLKPYVFPLIVGIVVLLGMIAGGTYLANGQNLLEAAQMTFASHWLRYLPVIGWYKGMIMCAVNGELFSFLVYLGLLLVSVAVLILPSGI